MRTVKEIAAGLEANTNLVADGCEDLPAYRSERDGFFLSRWQLTWRERLAVLVGGSVWLYVLGHGHPPVQLAVVEREVMGKPRFSIKGWLQGIVTRRRLAVAKGE
jgi:hypothetical protein